MPRQMILRKKVAGGTGTIQARRTMFASSRLRARSQRGFPTRRARGCRRSADHWRVAPNQNYIAIALPKDRKRTPNESYTQGIPEVGSRGRHLPNSTATTVAATKARSIGTSTHVLVLSVSGRSRMGTSQAPAATNANNPTSQGEGAPRTLHSKSNLLRPGDYLRLDPRRESAGGGAAYCIFSIGFGL
jgi:hypothetical protein